MKNSSLILILLCIISCNDHKVNSISQNEVISNKKTSICLVEINDTKWITTNTQKILQLPDSCVLQLIDSIKIRSSFNKEYFVCLDSIYSLSDGSISEYFIDVMTEVFYDNYEGISEYLSKGNSALKEILIEALSMDVADADNPIKQRANILKIINEKSKSKKIRLYMINIEKKIDPRMFD